MFKGKQVTFEGQTIFVGVDVHKTNWKVCVIIDGKKMAAFSQDPEPDLLLSYLNREFPGSAKISIAYEAGFSGFGACRQLRALGADCIVVNAADIPTSDKDRKAKNDKRDARKLATELSKGTLEGIYIPEPKMEKLRALVRLRKSMVNDRTSMINKLKHHVMCYSIEIEEESDKLTKKVKEQLRKLTTEDRSLYYLLNEYEHRCKLVEEMTAELEKLSVEDEDLKEIQALLRTIDGVGLITALTVQTELMDIKRFKTKDNLCSFVGLVPDIYSSNDKSARRGITRRANLFIKSVLVEAGWTATRKDPALRSLYYKYSSRMNGNKAIIRIAKHLLMRIRAVWINKEPYQRGMLSPLPESLTAA